MFSAISRIPWRSARWLARWLSSNSSNSSSNSSSRAAAATRALREGRHRSLQRKFIAAATAGIVAVAAAAASAVYLQLSLLHLTKKQ
ncbi:hypothetical protein Emag_005765 [Eimeria magna]